MSFDSDTKIQSVMGMNECKPDYEKQAAGIKKKLTATIKLKQDILSYLELGGAYRFNNVSSIAELIGGLTIVEVEHDKALEVLLKLLEKK